MRPALLITLAIAPALRFLPPEMDSHAARAMLVAIALQESDLRHRRQLGGPARGFWQFERGGGVAGVLGHPLTREHARRILGELTYPTDAAAVHEAIEHNDVLAAAFARLLLWTLPRALPAFGATDEGWGQYLDVWRPGRPHADRWGERFARGWEVVHV